MVINNWFDRHHDAFEKIPNNDFALKHERAYLLYTIACWAMEIVFVSLLYQVDIRLGVLATVRAIAGFLYSWTRKVFALSAVVTATMSALCSATPATVGGTNYGMWTFLVATTCAIFAWENLKDVQDFSGDAADGYKRTIAAVKGPNIARLVARYSMVFASLVFLAMPLTILPAPAGGGGIVCLAAISFAAYIVFNAREAKRLMGSGMAVFLILLNSSYWLLMTIEPVHHLALSTEFCVFVFSLLLGLMLAKPKLVSELVAKGIDDGSERLEKIRQGWLLWPIMYLAYWSIIFICRLVCRGGINCSIATALTSTLVLMILVIARPAHIHVPGRSHGYTVIERHSIGIVIGFFFVVCDLIGLPIPIVAFLLPFLTIVEFRLEPICRLLRSYGCWWGIIVGIAIVKGISFALINILPVYLAIVFIYFLWRWLHKIPVYIPKSKLGFLMLKFGFTPEEVAG